jgi:hypothetical protein
VKEQEVRNVLDLRHSDCRRWLLEEFLPLEISEGNKRRAKNNVVYFGKEPPSTVEELFPILLAPEIGGSNPFIQALGSWLRCHGCNGIVFPSARSDFSASERASEIETFSGWNFVDFRGAGAAPWGDHIGHVMSFNTYLGEAFSIECSEKGDCASIQVHGLLRQNIGRFNTMARHAQEGTDPSIFDISRGFLSVLDISAETLSRGFESKDEKK